MGLFQVADVLTDDDFPFVDFSVCRFVGLTICRFVGFSVCRFVAD